MVKYLGKQIRIDKGLSVAELVNRTYVVKNTIYNYEKGIHLPDLVTLDLLATALGVSPWDLIEFDGGKRNE